MGALSVAGLLSVGLNVAPAASPDSRAVSRATVLVQLENYIGLSSDGAYVNVTVGSNLRFSGRLFIDGKYEMIRGVLDGSGSYTGTYGKQQASFGVVRGIEGEKFTLTSFGRTVVAYPRVSRTSSLYQEGYYTLLLKSTETDPTLPPGTGYAVARVKKGGQITLAGKAADGTVISVGSYLTRLPTYSLRFPLFTTLYAGKGTLSGSLSFGADSFGGTLNWAKPWQKMGTYYRTGFSTELELAGYRYKPPTTGRPVLTFPGGAGVALELSGGGLSSAVAEAGVLTVANKVLVLGTNFTRLKVGLNVKTGLFSGSFNYPQNNKTVKIVGAIYQDSDEPEVSGYFRSPVQNGTGQCGGFTLKAPPATP